MRINLLVPSLKLISLWGRLGFDKVSEEDSAGSRDDLKNQIN